MCCRPGWRYGTRDDASLDTSGTTAEGARFSTWSITWKCWNASQARWRDRHHCNNGASRDGGRTVMTGSGKNLIKRNGKLSGTREMVELLLLGRERGYG